jgi:hypothetical protein
MSCASSASADAASANFSTLFKLKTVFVPRMKNPHDLRRFVGAAILLFLFFLPFHAHFSAKAQVSEECACCYYGGRIQMDLAPAVAILGPFAMVAFLIVPTTEALVQITLESELARAPPYSLTS